MSRIDELIRELCPEGVPKLPLGDLVTNRDNERQPITKSLRKSGTFPYYGANGVQDFVDSYIFDGTFLLVGEDGSVIGPDDAPVLNWAEGKIWVNNHAHVLEEKPGGVSLRFLFFYLSTIDASRFVTGGTQKKINQSNLNRIPIAVPPLEVQREIVSILDKFTQLEAELEAELEARRVQYEETRNNLLNFDQDLSSHPLSEMIRELCPNGVSTRLVGDLFAYEQPTKYLVDSTDYVDSGTPVLTAGQTFVLGHTLDEHGIYPATKEAPVIIFDDFTTSFQWVDFPFKAKSSAMKIISPRSGESVELRFLYHWMGVRNFQPGEHARHWISVYSQFEIPSPPLEVQRAIVSILDKLDALVNDISFGLPAEIVARRKQYEYYRNKLLTFKELDAA